MNLAEDDDEDEYDSDEGLLLMCNHHENVGDEKQKMKKGVPGVASGREAHTNEKVGKMRKLKQVIAKGSVFDLKTEDGSSRPCVPGKQKRFSFERPIVHPRLGSWVQSALGFTIPLSVLKWEDPRFIEVILLL